MKAFSYGGGVQSTAALVLAAQGEIPYKVFLFANTGDDSEDPRTLHYVRHIAARYAASHRLDLRILERRKRHGEIETLYGRLMRPGSRSLPIPVRMSNGAPGTRSCTTDFKIKVLGKQFRRWGATSARPASVGIGISLDEIQRANRRRSEPHEQIAYPLLDLGLRRVDCMKIIADAGLPVPPKSACWFCPLKSLKGWAELRRDRPQLFEKAATLESVLISRRKHLGKDPVFLTRTGRPLQDAITSAQDTLPFDPGCDSGWCMT